MNRKLTLLSVVALLVLVSGCTTTGLRDLPPEGAATGALTISSTPPGSEIYLDGVYMGTTPTTIPDVAGGSHILELRYRDYTPWSKSLEIRGGTTSYVDATLSPVTVTTPLPTTNPPTSPTTNPTTLQTTVHTTVPATTPEPKTIAGCWKVEHTIGNATEAYIYDLQEGGNGWIYGTYTTAARSESMSEEIRWSVDPVSAVVTIVEANPKDPADPDKWVLTYDEYADILDGGEKGQLISRFVRVPC
jgi:hypothetical protein